MKIYKVWIEIEEFDTESEEGHTVDAPGGTLVELPTYKEAYDFANRLQIVGEHRAQDIKSNAPVFKR